MKKILAIAAFAAAIQSQAGVSPAPKVGPDSTLAGVADVAAAMQNPVVRDYTGYALGVYNRNPEMKKLLDACAAAGLGNDDIRWYSFAVGKLVRPADDATSFKLPDVTATIVSKKPVTLDPLVALVKAALPPKLIEEFQKSVAIADATIAGEKAITFASKDPLPVDLKVCLGVVQGKALVFALTEGAFERQATLVKSPKVPSDPRFASVVKQAPESAGKMLIPQLGKVISSLAKPEELALLGEMPYGTPVATVLTGLGDVTLDLAGKDGALKYSLAVEFGTEADAEAIAALANARLVATKGQMRAAAEGDSSPETAAVLHVVDSIKCAQTGKKVTFEFSVAIDDMKKVLTDESVKDMVDSFKAIRDLIEDADDEDDDDDDDDDED